MSTLIGHIGTGTALQANATTGSGTAVDISGAVRAVVTVFDHSATAFTAGAFVLETSSDGGNNWATATNVTAAGTADGGTAVTFPVTLPTSGNPNAVYFLPHLDGPTQVRCRISTTVTGSAVDATIYPIGL